MTISSARSRGFDEALAVPADALLTIDGTIQRFEFAFELCWKTMKSLLQLESPAGEFATARATIRAAYAAVWLDDEGGWLDLLDMRNATSHTYREALARDVYRRIRARAAMLRATAVALRARMP